MQELEFLGARRTLIFYCTLFMLIWYLISKAEITKLLMEGLSQSQTNHLRHLKAFVAAQVEYYAQAHLVMQELNRELER